MYTLFEKLLCKKPPCFCQKSKAPKWLTMIFLFYTICACLFWNLCPTEQRSLQTQNPLLSTEPERQSIANLIAQQNHLRKLPALLLRSFLTEISHSLVLLFAPTFVWTSSLSRCLPVLGCGLPRFFCCCCLHSLPSSVYLPAFL